jgi:acyl-CoA thioesterase
MHHHPFADLIEWQEVSHAPGTSELSLQVQSKHMNPQQVVHGAVLFALANTGMWSAKQSLSIAERPLPIWNLACF